MPSLTRASLFLVGSLLVACAPGGSTAPTDPVEQVQINGTPTGSIQVPSLCERPATDSQVTKGGADSFAVLWADDHYQLVYADLLKQDVYSMKLSTSGAPIGAPVVVDAGPGAATLIHKAVPSKMDHDPAAREVLPASPRPTSSAL